MIGELVTPTESTQTWLDLHIIGENPKKTICPPLRRFSNAHRDESGRINWETFSRILPITDLTALNPYSAAMLTDVTERYLSHLRAIDAGTAPISEVLVLPDFNSNEEYYFFINKVKNNAKYQIMNSGVSLASSLYRKTCLARKFNPAEVDAAMDFIGSPQLLLSEVVDGIFGPIPFFARPLSDRFIAQVGFPGRGPMERYKYMVHSPYDSVQMVDAVEAFRQQSANMAVAHEHNNDLLHQDLGEFEAFIAGIRSGTIR